MIMSITDGVPEKLICSTCKSVHKFRAEKPAAAIRPPRPTAAVRGTSPRGATSPSRFQELMVEEHAGTKAITYSVTVHFEVGAWLDHPSFGMGKVQKRLGKKIDVLFRDGLKTLIST